MTSFSTSLTLGSHGNEHNGFSSSYSHFFFFAGRTNTQKRKCLSVKNLYADCTFLLHQIYFVLCHLKSVSFVVDQEFADHYEIKYHVSTQKRIVLLCNLLIHVS